MKKKTKRSRYEIDVWDIVNGLVCMALVCLFFAQWAERERKAYAYIDKELKTHNEYQQQVEQDKYEEKQKQLAMEN